LTYFLIEQPPAHCEFFASGAAVLLRLGGIPSRYVTGFVPTEYNLFGQCWIARNKDAHAWAEAFVGNRGWVTVDATPGPGRPQHQEHSPFALAWDAARFRVHELFVLLRADVGEALQRFVIGVATLLIKVIVSTSFGWALALVTLAALIALGKRVFRRRRTRRVPRVAPPHPMQFQVRDLERRLRRHGVVRTAAETLHHLAARLERDYAEHPWALEAAAWLRNYACVRYGRNDAPKDA
jgi:hypothetical protein